jgi:hypothetical protein
MYLDGRPEGPWKAWNEDGTEIVNIDDLRALLTCEDTTNVRLDVMQD